jgi:DNA-binding NarL/FixJ family response regulator
VCPAALGISPNLPSNLAVTSARRPEAAERLRKPIEVMIVCRAELLMLGLERLLSQTPEMRVFTYSKLPASVASEAGAPELPGEHPSGVAGTRPTRVAILSDRQTPDPVAECERLMESFADEVVLLSSRPDMSVLVGCMGAGARSFVMEGDRPEVLLAAVRSAARQRTFIGQRSLEVLVEWLAGQERAHAGAGRRGKDHDLLKLLAEGRSTGDIAERLGIAPKTVRNRLSELYRRLGVRSRAAAVRLAEERGLLDPTDRRRH